MTGQLTLPGGGSATQALQRQEIESLVSSEISNGTYWDRSGGTLSPEVSSDNVDIGGGNITLNANGSTVFKGKTHQFGSTSEAGPQYISVGTGGVSALSGFGLGTRPAVYTNTSSAGSTYFGVPSTSAKFTFRVVNDWNASGTEVAAIGGDGSASFAGTVEINGPVTSSAGILLHDFGGITTYVADDRPTSTLLNLFSDVGGTRQEKVYFKADGSATFANSRTVLSADGSIETYRSSGDGTSDLQAWQSDIGGTKLVKARIKANGSATFAGNITADNVTFNLEADDDTKYTATTDSEGNETLVYNGATLDVKDRLQKADAALLALKTAAVAATDFASLQAAIVTALADI